MSSTLDPHLPPDLREHLEESLWRPIERRAKLETLLGDPDFLADPAAHPAMFADHGVVHVRDVAAGVVGLAERVDGLFLPARPPARLRLLQTLGVAMAYIHDAGMVDMTPVGRATHALYAAHLAFTPQVDPLVDHLLSPGPVRDRLEEVDAAAPFGMPLEAVVREVLSLAVAHSKSKVPAQVLCEPEELAGRLRAIVFTPMAQHRAAAGGCGGQAPTAAGLHLDREVDHPAPALAYAWLAAPGGPAAALADDVVDAVRVLRAADVLRQRGSSLRTSGGYEAFFDARTGRAVCTLRPADGRAAYLITYDDPRVAGEANISMAVLTRQGHLRIAFHRGAFVDEEASGRAAASAAEVVLDIWADVAPSFQRVRARDLPPPAHRPEDMRIYLERPADRPGFADLVARAVRAADPRQGEDVVVVHDVGSAEPTERRRYGRARHVDPQEPLAARVLTQVGEHGSDLSHLTPEAAFVEVRCARVRAGEELVRAGSPPTFVYLPLGPGLVVHPTGGYPPAELHPWVPVGVTGAVRRAPRNGRIVAVRDVEVLMVPSEEFVTTWLRPLRAEQLAEVLVRRGPAGVARAPALHAREHQA